MGMEMPFGVDRAVEWGLMKSHGIGKRNVEDAVIGGNDLFQHQTELCNFRVCEFRKLSQVPAAAKQHLKWPYRPEGHNRDKRVVTENDSLLFCLFECDVVAEQTGMVAVAVAILQGEFAGRRFGDSAGRPDLAMGMGIAGAHHFAAILENLHMLYACNSREFTGLRTPGADDFFNPRRLHGGEGQIVPWQKAHDTADPAFGFGNQQAFIFYIEAGKGRVFFQSGKIILKYIG